MAMRSDRLALTLPRVIICEGRDDEAFLRALIRCRSIPDTCIRNPSDTDQNGTGGIDKFGKLLEGMATWAGFGNLLSIVIVADSDEEPAANLERVRTQIALARPEVTPSVRYEVPDTALSKTPGPPSVTIIMVPWPGQVGCLETLCLEAASASASHIRDCVEKFSECAAVPDWRHKTKQDKMKLKAMLASQHRKNPSIGLGNVWNQAPSLIPLNHRVFDSLEGELRKALS